MPYAVFLVIFVVLPLLLIVLYAFQDAEGNFTLENFVHFFNQPEVIRTFVYSVGIAFVTTAICLLLGYPAAYIMSRMRSNSAVIVVMLFILPMWINMLIRTMATVTLFDFLKMPLGQGALIFGMVYNYLPFMIYPIYNVLQKMDHNLIEAAEDLGAKPRQVFARVVLPLSMPGVIERRDDGVPAYDIDLRSGRDAHAEQDTSVRYGHSGEYQQHDVELRRCAVVHNVDNHRHNIDIYLPFERRQP